MDDRYCKVEGTNHVFPFSALEELSQVSAKVGRLRALSYFSASFGVINIAYQAMILATGNSKHLAFSVVTFAVCAVLLGVAVGCQIKIRPLRRQIGALRAVIKGREESP